MADSAFAQFTSLNSMEITKGDLLNKGQSKYRLIPKGEYAFTVKDYEFGTSKEGNPRVEVTLVVEAKDGEVYVSDYLTATPRGMWKFPSFFIAIGMMKGEKLRLTEDVWDEAIGKQGRFMNGHDTFNGKEKNKVLFYVDGLTTAER